MAIAPIVAALVSPAVSFIKKVGDEIHLQQERKLAEAQKPRLGDLTQEEMDMIEARRLKRGQQSTGK